MKYLMKCFPKMPLVDCYAKCTDHSTFERLNLIDSLKFLRTFLKYFVFDSKVDRCDWMICRPNLSLFFPVEGYYEYSSHVECLQLSLLLLKYVDHAASFFSSKHGKNMRIHLVWIWRCLLQFIFQGIESVHPGRWEGLKITRPNNLWGSRTVSMLYSRNTKNPNSMRS